MLALRVPCDARMSRRDANSLRSDSASRKLRIILRFSASLNGNLRAQDRNDSTDCDLGFDPDFDLLLDLLSIPLSSLLIFGILLLNFF